MKKFIQKLKQVVVKVKEFVARKLRKSKTKPIDEEPISDIIKTLVADGKLQFDPSQQSITGEQFMTIFDAMTGGFNFGV